MVPAPEDPYGIAKAAVERDLAAAVSVFGLRYTIFRPHNVYGTRQNLWDKHRNVVAIFLRQALSGQPMTIFGDGTQTRAFSHIESVVGPMIDCIGREDTLGHVFNVGGMTPVTINELAGAVSSVLGVPHRVKHLPPRHEVAHAWCDHRKTRRWFGDLGTETLVGGLASMAAWAKRAIRRRRFVRDFWPLELTDKLPPSWAEQHHLPLQIEGQP
jgi:UDP-glucose 4-epimerase